jgi:hypothetical protein
MTVHAPASAGTRVEVILLAQSLLEYGVVSSLVSSLGSALNRAEAWVEQQNPMVLLAVGGIAAIVLVYQAFR